LRLLTQGALATALTDFNLIALGDLTAGTSEVEGRAVVFGDITTSNAINFAILPDAIGTPTTKQGVSQDDALIVGGQSFTTLSLNNGNARFGGASTGPITNNASSVTFNDTGVAASLDAIRADVIETTNFLDSLSANSSADLDNMVFDLDASFFSRNGTIDLQGDLDADLFVFRLLDETTTELDVSNALNSLSNEFSDPEFQSRIAFYLPNITSLDLPNGLGGAIIAPNADLTFGSPLEGTVVANNLQLNAEIHLPTLDTSVVPEPSALALIASEAVLLSSRRRRRS